MTQDKKANPLPQLSSVLIEQQKISFMFRQNKRIKGPRLVVSPEEGLVYETPKTPLKYNAKTLIKKNQSWVLKTLQQQKKKSQAAQHLKKLSQSVFVFGKEKKVSIKMQRNHNWILETTDQIRFGFTEDKIRKLDVENQLQNWLNARAKIYLPLRLKLINQNQFDYKIVKVKNSKTQWGSCTHDKTINLNWRLILAPQDISDYVIFHELTHTVHMNHSPKFWKLLEKVYPQTKKAEDWLKKFEFLLHTNLFNAI